MDSASSLTRLQRKLFVVRTVAYAGVLPLAIALGGRDELAGRLVLMSAVAWFVPWLIRERPGGALFVALTLDSIMAVVGGAALGLPILFEFGPLLAVATGALLLTRAQMSTILAVALVTRTLGIFGTIPGLPAPTASMFGTRMASALVGVAMWSFVAVVLRQFRLALTRESQRASEAEVRWREYLQRTDQPILVHQNGVIVDANPALLHLTGSDVVGSQLDEVLHHSFGTPTDGPRHAMLKADGALREVQVATVPTTMHGATADMSILTDLTERRMAEREAQRLTHQINSLFERLPVALYRASADGTILAANQALSDLLGYANTDALIEAHSRHGFFARPSRRDDFDRLIKASGFVRGFEHEVRRRDGSTIWVESTARVVRALDGSIEFFEGAMADVTGRVSAAASHERLLAIIEQASDVVVVIGANGHILYANRAARHFYGVGDDSGSVTYLPIAPAWLHEARDALAADVPFAAEQTLHTPSGHTRQVHAVIEGHRDRTGQLSHISIIARDITELREAQERLERLVANKDEFIASVSHELRTPLSVVVGLSQELLENSNLEERERSELMEMIADQSNEVANLVEDLLVAARADTGAIRIHPEAVNLEEMVHAVLRSILPQKSVPVEGGAKVIADAHRVRQIIRNLITNAQKYGGDRIRVSINNGGSSATLIVADDGEGIPRAARERVFDPYERAHYEPTRPGSVGLGLSVSRQLARLMDGELRYRYADGWSQFELELPALAD